MMDDTHDILVIGDIHGQYEKLARLLQQAGLVDANLSWTGGATTLWFMGDFFDRGPDGIAVVDLVMRLQNEARAAGGNVQSLLGNHEVLLLAAQKLEEQLTGTGETFLSDWKRNGGQESDLARLTQEHIDWITSLPAMARVGTWLFVHADATLYTKYGSSIEEVNHAFQSILQGDDDNAAVWDQLLDDFSRREEFADWQPEGEQQARLFLRAFDARRLLHGHSPLHRSTAISEVKAARVYAGGLCVNVDGGMYLGGPGFVYRLPRNGESDET